VGEGENKGALLLQLLGVGVPWAWLSAISKLPNRGMVAVATCNLSSSTAATDYHSLVAYWLGEYKYIPIFDLNYC
jgi:hypothetical protein